MIKEGIIKSLKKEIENVEIKSIDIFDTRGLEPLTVKFIENINYFVEILDINTKKVTEYKITESIYKKLIQKLKKINKEYKGNENIEYTFFIKFNYDYEDFNDYYITSIEKIEPAEILKYKKDN